jgi:Skp family chaperone for outer membrane proteins
MLSRFAQAVLLTSLTVFPYSSYGQAANADETLRQQEKIGKLNIQDVIASTRVGKKTLEGVKKQFEAKQRDLSKQNAEIDSLKRRLSDQSGKLSDKERDKLTATIESKEKTLHSNVEEIREQVQRVETKVVEKLGAKVLQVLSNYAKTNGYAAILDTSGPTIGILWASEGTVRKLGLTGKSQPEIEKGLLTAFTDKQASLIDQELIKACDAEIHSMD